MPKERLSVVVTRRLPAEVETRLSELFDVSLRDDDTQMTRQEIVDAMKTADVLVPTITDTVDASMIGQAGDRLKLIANYGAGVDNIDVPAARVQGCFHGPETFQGVPRQAAVKSAGSVFKGILASLVWQQICQGAVIFH